MTTLTTGDDRGPTAESSSTRVSNELRKLIITGEIRPGEHIRAREIAERFNVSHIPVREAMRQLEGEGLVHYRENRGAVASAVSAAELRELYSIRRHIECDAARRAARLYSESHLEELEKALEELERARSVNPRSEAFFSAHHRFHWLLIGPGCSRLAERILTDLWRSGDRYVYLGLETEIDTGPGKHHRELFRAALRRDPDVLGGLVDEHLRITEAAVSERLPDLMLVADGLA